jgi:hypothetical protein
MSSTTAMEADSETTYAMGRYRVVKNVNGRLPSDANQSVVFKTAKLLDNLPYSQHISVDDVLVIDIYTSKTLIQYKDATGNPKFINGLVTNYGNSIRVDAVDDLCFWFSCDFSN